MTFLAEVGPQTYVSEDKCRDIWNLVDVCHSHQKSFLSKWKVGTINYINVEKACTFVAIFRHYLWKVFTNLRSDIDNMLITLWDPKTSKTKNYAK